MSNIADQSWHVVIEEELKDVPLEDCHKELIVGHFRRLKHILHERDEASIGSYTNKQAALEQLARMTLVIRDYVSAHNSALQQGDTDNNNIESMVADVVDASLFIGGVSGTFTQPMSVNSQLWGREQEIAILMQETSAESADDVIELWNVVPEPTGKVVPDGSAVDDIGRDIDWGRVLLRARSESNILQHQGHRVIEHGQIWRRSLEKREREELNSVWPPAPKSPEPKSVRRRKRFNTMTRNWLAKRLGISS